MDESQLALALVEARSGDQAAATRLWNAYFHRLVELARHHMTAGNRRVRDEEDIALSALHSFMRRVEDGAFPDLKDSEELWKLLVTITLRKAKAQWRHETRQVRGGGKVRGESLFIGPNSPGLAEALSAEPSFEMIAEVGDTCVHLISRLPNETLRDVAKLKIDGLTNEEIARELGYVSRTVKRKIALIRQLWSDYFEEEGHD